MSAYAARLNLRLFIDGLEVPVVGARCTFADNADAQADIQLIATDQLMTILPRSAVHLFYYETYDLDISTGKEASLGPEDPRRWKLLFFGEVAAVSMQKNDGQRMGMLSCVGPMNYLDFIRQHYLNFRNGGVEFFENAFMGVTADRIKNYDVVGKGVASNLFVWLSASKVKVDGETYSNIYTGTQRLVREMFYGSSVFYAQAFNRLRIGDMIVGLPSDKTAAKLMKMDFFQKFIKNQVGGGGGMVSARQMADMLLGTVMHSMTTIPCPRLDERGAALGLDIQTTSLGGETVSNQPYEGASLNYVVVKPDTWFLAPPTCNIVFPHQYNKLTFQRNYLSEPTRLMLRTSLFFTGRDKWMTERFYSPDFEEINKVMYREGGHLDRMASILLGHEEFVGLNPLFTWESDLGAYVQKGARREYLSQLADYTFWKYRFSTRTMNMSGQFNPNLVPGYPALIMDRVGVPGALTRHYMGNVQSIVHSIDQNGGWTHATLTGCYQHDEAADFDGKGRSLNQVTRRGTDGFLDDRYDWENIGEEVYQTIFGCGSLVDVTTASSTGSLADAVSYEGDEIDAALSEDADPLVRAVAYLQLLYQTLLEAQGDVDQFSKSLSQRPKANMAQMIGLPSTRGLTTLAEEFWMDQLTSVEGFHSACVDNGSTVDDNYVSTKSYQKTVAVDVPAKDILSSNTRGETVIEGQTEARTDYKSVSVTENKTTSYGLADLLKKRQAVVQAYIDSLTYRGLRG